MLGKKRKTFGKKYSQSLPSIPETEDGSEIIESLSDEESKEDHKEVNGNLNIDVNKKKRVKVPLTYETITLKIGQLMSMVEEEIKNMKTAKLKGVKFLKSLNKNVKNLDTYTKRFFKKLKLKPRKQGIISGFSKPVPISKELSKFTGWEDEKKSRIDVTRYICNYISSHGLQDPEDRRIIRVDKDPKLSKLLSYNEDEPLTYFKIQKYLKKHYPKD